MMKSLIFTFWIVIVCQLVNAQIFVNGGDPMLDTLLNRRVKSLDEFLARFNGVEFNPSIPQSVKETRENNILALFNNEMLLNEQKTNGENSQLLKDISEFILDVCKGNKKLNITDSLFFCETQLNVKFQGKDCMLNMILRMEDRGDDIFCWTLSGINGMIENNILDTVVSYGIRPVDHEVDFVQLRGFMNNPENNIARFRYRHAVLDPLSYFFALVNTKQIQVLNCNKIVYHIFSIKGYYAKIEQFMRKDFNSGWLISEFKKIAEQELQYNLNKLFDR